jgi:hypothetical protein
LPYYFVPQSSSYILCKKEFPFAKEKDLSLTVETDMLIQFYSTMGKDRKKRGRNERKKESKIKKGEM